MRIEIKLHDEKLKESILKLKYNSIIDDNGIECDMIFIPESDYGFAEIYRMYDDILVFLIPTYGGIPSLQYHVSKHGIDKLLKDLRQMT
jgi:hypothetical protein